MWTSKLSRNLLTKSGSRREDDDLTTEPVATKEFCRTKLSESQFQKLSVPRYYSRVFKG